MSTPDFIGVYDNALTLEECDELISFFESSPKMQGGVGKVGEGFQIDPKIKSNIELKGIGVSETPIISERILKYVSKYVEEYQSLTHIYPCDLVEEYTFQKLQYYGDGYKIWHTEHAPFSPDNRRVLVWMFYLNDTKSGTEFMHFPTIKGRKGRCIIWPSSFTHMHKSEPNKGLKYIMSGWISYTDPDLYKELEERRDVKKDTFSGFKL